MTARAGTVTTPIPSLGLMPDDVLLVDLADLNARTPIGVYRDIGGDIPLRLIAQVLLLALDTGQITASETAFRSELAALAASGKPNQPRHPGTPTLTLVCSPPLARKAVKP
jgi:hypothetical protein